MDRRFRDREEAGRLLGEALLHFQDQEPVILGVPRGGVLVAVEVARRLNAPLDVIIARKIGAPHQPELAIGAVVSGGRRLLDQQAISQLGVTQAYIDAETAVQRDEIERRIKAYRGQRSPMPLKDRTVILIDDGIATGYTIRAAISGLREEGVAKLVVAVPVAPASTCEELRRLADEVVCLNVPERFFAVGACYEDFEQNTDQQVTAALV